MIIFTKRIDSGIFTSANTFLRFVHSMQATQPSHSYAPTECTFNTSNDAFLDSSPISYIENSRRPQRLAIFSDSNGYTDGVSSWCNRFVRRAQNHGYDVAVPNCHARVLTPDVCQDYVAPLASFVLPLYSHMKLHVPAPSRMVKWARESKITHVELATPGTMGLVGLYAAKRLGLPVTATYHTHVPGLITCLKGGELLLKATQNYLRWFYEKADQVLVLSPGARRILCDIGVNPRRIEVIPVVIDTDEFSPRHRDRHVFGELDLSVGASPVVLSVGRASREKNIPLMIEAVAGLQNSAQPPHLVVVGDGPARNEWEHNYRHLSFVHFVGMRYGLELSRLYASADAFVFASQADTLGLVTFEAMASGTPVLLPENTCAAECIQREDGQLAHYFVLNGDCLTNALSRVLSDTIDTRNKAHNARQHALRQWNKFPFSTLWDYYTPRN